MHSAASGFNACIFAYGQTGSGKTHTMRGVQHLAAEHLFQIIDNAHGRDFVIRLTALEIYNEVRGLAGASGCWLWGAANAMHLTPCAPCDHP